MSLQEQHACILHWGFAFPVMSITGVCIASLSVHGRLPHVSSGTSCFPCVCKHVRMHVRVHGT